MLWLVLTLAYATQWRLAPRAWRADLTHPVKMPFAAALTVGLLLVATALSDAAPALATVLWWIGAPSHLLVTIAVLSHWIRHPDVAPQQVLPTWFVPVVGNLVTPLAGPTIGHLGLSWIAFGVGVTFWVALLPLVLGRYILVQPPVPLPMTPVFAILIAPPAVAIPALQSLAPQAHGGALTWVLYAGVLAFTALLLAMAPTLARTPFGLPWWATSFPLTAASTATTIMAALRGGAWVAASWVLLVAVSVLIAVLSVLTVRAAALGRLVRPD